MRTINILSIGHNPPGWIVEGCKYYQKLLKQKYKLELIHLSAISTKLDNAQRISKETDSIINKIPTGSYVIALDESGIMHTSQSFSEFMIKTCDNFPNITFIIGPSDGLNQKIIDKCNKTISLSSLTFTHDIAKLLLLEQLYRSHCITSGHPYHRV